MKIREAMEVAGNAGMYILTFSQTKEVFEIVSLVLSIIISLLIIISKVVTWYNKAMEDGKISKDEIKQLPDILKDEANNIKDNVEAIKKKGDNKDAK